MKIGISELKIVRASFVN